MNVMVKTPSVKADTRTRVALLVPSSNTVMENDLHRGLPKNLYTVHTDRMYLIETTRQAEIRMIEDFAPQAASDLGTLNPHLFVFGCTSGGSLFGLDYDASICAKLGCLAGCPSLGVVSAASEALRHVAAKRIAVITPYIDDLTQSVAGAAFDFLFVSCTNFRSLEAKEELECEFDVPVVTSNSAVIDAIRRRFEMNV